MKLGMKLAVARRECLSQRSWATQIAAPLQQMVKHSLQAALEMLARQPPAMVPALRFQTRPQTQTGMRSAWRLRRWRVNHAEWKGMTQGQRDSQRRPAARTGQQQRPRPLLPAQTWRVQMAVWELR